MWNNKCFIKCPPSRTVNPEGLYAIYWQSAICSWHAASNKTARHSAWNSKKGDEKFQKIHFKAVINNNMTVGNSCTRQCTYIYVISEFRWGTAVAQWLWSSATNPKVAVSIPVGFIGIFHWYNPSDRTMALGLTQPLTEMSTRRISWG